jgi:hypothetical protein
VTAPNFTHPDRRAVLDSLRTTDSYRFSTEEAARRLGRRHLAIAVQLTWDSDEYRWYLERWDDFGRIHEESIERWETVNEALDALSVTVTTWRTALDAH